MIIARSQGQSTIEMCSTTTTIQTTTTITTTTTSKQCEVDNPSKIMCFWCTNSIYSLQQFTGSGCQLSKLPSHSVPLHLQFAVPSKYILVLWRVAVLCRMRHVRMCMMLNVNTHMHACTHTNKHTHTQTHSHTQWEPMCIDSTAPH